MQRKRGNVMQSYETNGIFEFIQVPIPTQVHFTVSSDPGSYVPKHWHPALELILLLEGGLIVQNGSREEICCKDQWILISPYTPHSTKCMTGNRAVLLQIPLDFLKHWIPDAENYYFRLPPVCQEPEVLKTRKQIRDLLLQMMETQSGTSDTRLLRFQSLLFELLFQLFQNFATRSVPGTSTKSTKNLERLEPVLSYIRTNYRRPISLSEISEIACLEEGYFCRFFKKMMGITFLEYQNQLRLSFICQDLFSTDDSVELIRERHGFTNERLFRRMFREQFHTTPSQLRKQEKSPDSHLIR